MKREGQGSTLFEQIQDRRTILRRALLIGTSVPAMGTLLAACGGDDNEEPEDESPTASADVTTPTTAATESQGGTEAETETPSTPETEEEASPTSDAANDTGEGVRGGTFRVALPGEPPTLDIHQTTAGITSLITWSIYEPLFTFDDGFQLIPMLAESFEVSEDGLTNTLTLRQGVPFHNGDEMIAADVKASIERWGAISGLGKSLLDSTDEISEIDDYTLEFSMKEPFGAFAPTLALNYQGCAIYPKSLIDEAAGQPLDTTFIGTGPYKFLERQTDRYIRFERFDDYVGLPGEPNGYGGQKYQYVDQIEFVPVPDEAARVAGIQAGDYHYLSSVSSDQFSTLEGDSNVAVETLTPHDWDMLVLNWKSPMMGNPKIRQAFQAALDCEPILIAAHGEEFYRLDPSVMMKETAWYSTIGEDLYDRKDPELAKQLLEEAGYDGTPLRMLSTQEYQYLYNITVVATQQLEEAGFTVDLQVTDWATLVDRRGNPDLWDAFPTSIPFAPDPTQLSIMQLCTWPGWWCDDETAELFTNVQRESDFDTRFGYWEEIQSAFYNDVPIVKIGDFSSILVLGSMVRGFAPMTQLTAAFWNVWLEE